MFEPFPGNYVWNLGLNLALICGGNHGELDEVWCAQTFAEMD